MKDEVSLKDVQVVVRDYWRFLVRKWYLIGLVGILFGALGILYATLQKPVYTAEITFAPENDKGGGMGMYAGLAAQFGLDLGSGGGGVFEGENLIMFLHSNMLVERALFTPVVIENKNDLLINYYIRTLQVPGKDESIFAQLRYTPDYTAGDRLKDSLVKVFIKQINSDLVIEKADKKVNIIVARMRSHNELFAKYFVESLVNNGIAYYVDYRSKKTRENVNILQRQTDSVRGLLSSGIVSVAASSDLNVNPARQVVRAGVQRRQVDVQANSRLYEELVKQLELSKIALRKETPLIQIIDTPRFPLEKKKLGRLKGAIIFAFAGTAVFVLLLVSRRAFSSKPRIVVNKKAISAPAPQL